MKQSQAWKALEREAARLFGGKRISRGANFAESDVDVSLPGLRYIKVDAKYRKHHAHHSLIEEIKRKYCKGTDAVPLMVTKHHRQRGSYATMPTEFAGILLDCLRWMQENNVAALENIELRHQKASIDLAVEDQNDLESEEKEG